MAYEFHQRRRIEFADTDTAGIAHFSRFFCFAEETEHAFLRAFVDTVAATGCDTFIVHARKAWLSGLSPKENREIPPLRYDTVYRLKQDFPALRIVINGGIRTLDACEEHLRHVDGVMLGREAYENPWLLADADPRLFGDGHDVAMFQEQSARFGKGYTHFAPTPLGRWYASHLSGEAPLRFEFLMSPPADFEGGALLPCPLPSVGRAEGAAARWT